MKLTLHQFELTRGCDSYQHYLAVLQIMSARNRTSKVANHANQTRLGAFLPYQLAITFDAVSTRIAGSYHAALGLKVPEWRVMTVLGEIGAAAQCELVDLTLQDKVTVYRACKSLGTRGLVARSSNVRDGRSHLLELTSAGEAVFREIWPQAEEASNAIFNVLSATELKRLRTMLEKIYTRASSSG
ncbi:MarR family winged helix-turn-helix transcriptional regulator [Novosphingobium cyanobacteriorum]|uniref:MarR family winged helix-turn-helix transcriptional regulator n=1 Tax=Novosphingobium cyanobacteriorum TaxID=3024215 RepID=A0ABT6CIC0_9SPHN|nr:MarR family winged helix-turn-helix transcriptional regulator [Novosphingobium cyanobacteriorum]MDF8333670.1 MarR family winged helix-turn-helix transcriptional regulator [Novosphingobium cyanobacteriorum]